MSILRQIYETLREFYETKPQQVWWPDDPTEVVIAAVLVQGTTWKSVDRVLQTLKDQKYLDFQRLLDAEEAMLAELIRPVGFHAKKAKRLKEISKLFLDRTDGDPVRFFARDVDTVRRELLTISGIGPGTADNMLLYAGRVPIYMVDPFTVRILGRHGVIGLHDKETDIQNLVHRELTPDEEPYGAKLFGDFQALIVRTGREFCDKTDPSCSVCPLHDLLPESGPIGLGEKASLRVASGTKTAIKSLTASSDFKTETKPENAETSFQPIDDLNLNENERKIVEFVGSEQISIDSLVQSVGLPVHIVRATIAVLEMRKILKQVEGNQVKRIG